MEVSKLTLDLGKVYEVFTAFSALEGANKSLPFKFSWKIEDIRELLKKYAERFEKQRLANLKEFGEASKENPTMFSIPVEKLESYNKKMEELTSEVVTIEVTPLTYKLLDEVPNLQIPPGVIGSLKEHGFLIKDSKEKESSKKEEKDKT